MEYREDKDLEFLSKMDDQDLEPLVRCIIYDTDGKARYTQELTKSKGYKDHHPQHHKYWKEIATEIQYFGADTIVSMIRRKGVLYDEIARDVASKLKVNLDKNDTTIEQVEKKILENVLRKTINQLTSEEQEKIFNDLEIEGSFSKITKDNINTIIDLLFSRSGLSYLLINIIMSMVSTTFVPNTVRLGFTAGVGEIVAGRSLAILSPALMVIMSGTLVGLLSGPAYRVTIPSVLIISCLRLQYHNFTEKKREELKEDILRHFRENS